MAVSLPSVSTTTGTLNAPGIGSGLDVKGIISQLMAVEQRPLTLLAQQEATYQSKLTSLGSINGSLSSLQSAAQTLASASAVKNGATLSDASVLSATAASDAVPGKYSVTVNKLAQAQKLLAAGKTSTTTAIGSGASTTLTFTFGTISSVLGPVNGIYSDASFAANSSKTPVAVVIGSGNNTLAGIRDAINAAAVGVTASIINDGGAAPYRLALAPSDTGAANSLKIATSGDSAIGSLLAYDPASATQNLQQTQAARNADLSIDGVSIASASNTVTGAIEGITLNLAKETAAGSPVSVSVQRDTGALESALKALVAAYNDSNKTIAGATAKAAVLQGDAGVLGVQYRVHAMVGGVQQTEGAYTTLSQLGASFQKDGALSLDSAKLNAALASDPAGFAALTSTLGNAIDSAVAGLLVTSGSLSSETDGIKLSITSIGSRRAQIQKHLEVVQAHYQKQFSALDALISSMNQTSTYLTQQLANLPNIFNNKG